jgi:hypothetical protein
MDLSEVGNSDGPKLLRYVPALGHARKPEARFFESGDDAVGDGLLGVIGDVAMDFFDIPFGVDPQEDLELHR